LVLDILRVNYLLTSITVPDPQTSDWNQLALASSEIYVYDLMMILESGLLFWATLYIGP